MAHTLSLSTMDLIMAFLVNYPARWVVITGIEDGKLPVPLNEQFTVKGENLHKNVYFIIVQTAQEGRDLVNSVDKQDAAVASQGEIADFFEEGLPMSLLMGKRQWS